MGIERLPHASWVDIGGGHMVLAMAAPTGHGGAADAFQTLASVGVRRVVYLLGAESLESTYGGERALAGRYMAAGIEPYWVPTPNLGVPSDVTPMAEALAFLDEAGSGGGAVHCRYGVGRTGLALCCAMVARGAGTQQAVESLRRQRNTTLQSRDQLWFLTEFAAQLGPRHAEGA